MPQSRHWRALTAESTLAARQVAAAGPTLGDLDPGRVGSFYAAFFPLSIGYERMAKIALHVDCRIETGEFISTQTMRSKKFSHDLDQLFNRVEEVCERRGYDIARPVEPVHLEILSILTEFAKGGRYNHLDTLGSPTVTSKDAEQEWHQRVLPLLAEKHLTARMRERILKQAMLVAHILELGKEDILDIAGRYDVSGETHANMATLQLVRDIYISMNPWGRMYALQLGRWLARVLNALARDAMGSVHARDHVPYLIEFFAPLTSPDSLLRERRNLMRG